MTPQDVDEHGWPTDPNHPSNRDTRSAEERLEEIFRRKLDRMERAWLDQSVPALSAAVKLCSERGRPLPGWVSGGVQQMLRSYGMQSGKKGRHARRGVSEQDTRKHYIRWDAVRELRDRRDELEPHGYKPTWDAAYDNASAILAQTEGFGSPEAIKKSYQLVERLFREGKGARFYQTTDWGKK